LIKRDFTVLIIAVISGVAAFMLILNFLREAAEPKREFVIAAREIRKDQVITKEQIKPSKPMKSATSEDLFLQLEDVLGNRALEDIPEGKLIQRSKVKKRDLAAKVSKKETRPIPKGMRALTISAADVDQIPSLVDLDSFVDVLGRVPNFEGGLEMKTVVQGAPLLSIDQPEGSLAAKSITVALSPAEAETLIGALAQGKVRIVVRSDAGERAAFQPSYGMMEIIRGVNKQTKVAIQGLADVQGKETRKGAQS